MLYRNLGTTDIKVSALCLGTMTWGEQNSKAEAFAQMDYALERGINFWDTAELYSIPPKQKTQGLTEQYIGDWFRESKKRDQVVLATKVVGPSGMNWFRGGSRLNKEHITQALESSLKRLKTDYVDLYQVHWPERTTNFFGRRGYAHVEDENH